MAEQKIVAVDRATCTACCHQLIPLTPSDLKRKKNWQADRDGSSAQTAPASIWCQAALLDTWQPARRLPRVPLRKWAAQMSPKQRYWIRAPGDQHDLDMLDAGLRRAP